MSVELGHTRTRPDRCPGAVRPWPAVDGALVRLRPAGGRLALGALRALLSIAEAHGDGRVHVTGRANLQLRALPLETDPDPGAEGRLAEPVLLAIEDAGLLPSRAHDKARNIVASPCTGLVGDTDGRADLRAAITALDDGLLADPGLAALPGRFWFALDDGRGDLADVLDERADLGLVALDAETVQLRVGGAWAAVLGLDDAPAALLDLAREFLAARGTGPDAPWHVRELPDPLASPAAATRDPAPGAVVRSAPLPHGPVPGGVHLRVGDDGLTRDDLDRALTPGLHAASPLVVTPWRGLLIPHPAGDPR